MWRSRVGAANPLLSLWRALWRPMAPASRTKSRRTTEESRTTPCHVFYFTFFSAKYFYVVNLLFLPPVTFANLALTMPHNWTVYMSHHIVLIPTCHAFYFSVNILWSICYFYLLWHSPTLHWRCPIIELFTCLIIGFFLRIRCWQINTHVLENRTTKASSTFPLSSHVYFAVTSPLYRSCDQFTIQNRIKTQCLIGIN